MGISLSDLLVCVSDAEKGKRKSKETVKYMMKCEYNTVQLWKDINNRTYVPDGNYAFVVLIPKPREIFATAFKNRVVHHYLYKRIMPLIEKNVPRRTFSNRKGLGGDRAIANVYKDIWELSDKYTKDCWVMKVDLKGYFPNASWQLAYNKLRDLVINEYDGEDKEDVLYLLHTCLFANAVNCCEKRGDVTLWRYIEPEKSLFNKPYGVGAAIGWLIWQMAMLYYLVDLDVFLDSQKGIRYSRFVDDIVIIGNDKHKLLQLMNSIRPIVKANNCEINETKFYFQHYSKGLEFLGSHLKYKRIYLNNKTIHRLLCKIRFFNKVPDKVLYVNKFQQSLNSYFGMMKRRSERKLIYNLVFKYIDRDWWHYVKFNKHRCCVQIRKSYKYF